MMQSLGRFGVAGRVEVEGQLVWLIGHGPTVEVALPELLTTSAAQTPAELQRIAERLARDLRTVDDTPSENPSLTPAGSGGFNQFRGARRRSRGASAAVRYLLPNRNRPASPIALAASGTSITTPIAVDVSAEERARDYQACLQTVARIQHGGSVTPLDIDGWVVELSLISDKPDLNPGSAALLKYSENRPHYIELFAAPGQARRP